MPGRWSRIRRCSSSADFQDTLPILNFFSSYDSYGPKLLAYLVSEVTGEPFIDYVEHAILVPLKMSHTYLAARQTPVAHRVVAFAPKTPSLAATVMPLESRAQNPLVGGAVSTMSDMARLVSALVGPADDQTVITQPMRDLMFGVLQSNGPYGSAHGLLFDALRSGPTRLFVHGGVGPGQRCMLGLDVRRHAGLFYCYGDVRSRFDRNPAAFPPAFEDITDQMLKPFVECRPEETPDCVRYPPAAWHDAWNRYLGLYVNVARHHHGFSRLRTVIHPTLVRISRDADALRLDDKSGFVEIAPGVFGNPKYLETVSFIRCARPRKNRAERVGSSFGVRIAGAAGGSTGDVAAASGSRRSGAVGWPVGDMAGLRNLARRCASRRRPTRPWWGPALRRSSG